MTETILVVDDEDSVRKTFREWLEGAGLGCQILATADAETALSIANRQPIDLAILDWNLGAGNNGLQLLEDLYLFNPDVVAIMITGYAHQATPLDAMRMGVRDYLDKSHDLDREIFLAAVRKQLDRIRPAKRQRTIQRSLTAFREAVVQVLPLIQAAAAINDPVPLTDSIRHLFGFMQRISGASDGVLVVRTFDPDRGDGETYQAYDIEGRLLQTPLLPFPQSLASAVASMQDVCILPDLAEAPERHGVQLQPFEKEHRSLLAAPLPVGPGVTVVLELFDKDTPRQAIPKAGTPRHPLPETGKGRKESEPLSASERGGEEVFTDDDKRLVSAAARFGGEMLKQAIAERQSHGMLFQAVEAALKASEQAIAAVGADVSPVPQERGTGVSPVPASTTLDSLRSTLERSPIGSVDSEHTLRLAELVRAISVRHGREATEHCIRLLEEVDRLLNAVAGVGEGRP